MYHYPSEQIQNYINDVNQTNPDEDTYDMNMLNQVPWSHIIYQNYL